ncbi:MAG: hypothetical protein QM617_05025 [Comamonas sp.]
MTNRLTWIKRRARRLEAAFGTPRRVAIGEAIMDCNAFAGTRVLRVVGAASRLERMAA